MLDASDAYSTISPDNVVPAPIILNPTGEKLHNSGYNG